MAGSRLIEITWISTSDQTSTGRSKHFAAHTILAFFKSEWHIKTEPRPMFPDFLFLLRECRQGSVNGPKDGIMALFNDNYGEIWPKSAFPQ